MSGQVHVVVAAKQQIQAGEVIAMSPPGGLTMLVDRT